MPTSQLCHHSLPPALRASVQAAVKLLASPFRKCIWRKTNDYHFGRCTEQELNDVAQVYDIVAAKLRIAFPTPTICKELLAVIAALPDDPIAVTSVDLIPMLTQYLRATKNMHGVGIPMAICVLAVMKNGRYAPMDGKDAAGLQHLGVVTNAEAQCLTGTAIGAFVQVYTTKVLPAWHKENQERTPEQVDAFWGAHARTTPSFRQQ